MTAQARDGMRTEEPGPASEKRPQRDQKTQLLSPAGSYEILRAVISAGADAVYAGAQRFSARAHAENFTDEEILRAMDEAHLRGVQFYLAVNTLIKDSEMSDALRMVERFYEAGLDAVIVQDFGLAAEIGRTLPDLERHASTQMSVTGPYGMKLLEETGFSQAVLPRELSLEEIRRIRAQTDLKLECFVHGALCCCYSGKCLMSSMIGGRSANRGKCAQPCRLPYQLMHSPGGRMQSGKEIYPLSLRDLCAAESIPALIDAGVASFKIEGRMKGIEYAAGVTEIYREIIDRAQADSAAEASGPARAGGHTQTAKKRGSAEILRQEERKHLKELGSRSGFTNGYLEPQTDGKMVSMHVPSHRRETESTYVRQISEKYKAEPEKLPADLLIRIRRGKEMTLTLSCAGHAVTVTGDPVQEASGRPVTEETVREKVRKLGGTPFYARSCEVELDAGCFVPVSGLNRLRQQAVSDLLRTFGPQRMGTKSEIEGGHFHIPASSPGAITGFSEEDGCRAADQRKPRLYVSVLNNAQLSAVLRQPQADAVLLDCDAFPPGKRLADAEARIHAAEKKCIYLMPHTFRPKTAARWRECFGRQSVRKAAGAAGCGTGPEAADGFMLRNADEIAFFRDPVLFPEMPLLLADAGLYCWNKEARAFLKHSGISLLTVPYELSRREMTGDDSILTIYGSVPLMVSAQCVLKNISGCRKQPGGGQTEEEILFLHDRKGKSFPVRRLCTDCENVIYNCVPVQLFSEAARIRTMAFAGYRMDFLSETPAQIEECFRCCGALFEGGMDVQIRKPFTCGAWKRGTE